MLDKRTFIRRMLQVIAIVSSAGACVVSGNFGMLIAVSTPVLREPALYRDIPRYTEMVIETVPSYPMIGWIFATVVLIGAILGFLLTRNEDTRLQTVLVLSVGGYAVAVQILLTIGIALIVIPAKASGI